MRASDPIARALRSTIGLKVLMALTGLAMVAFVVIHMTGHLQMFEGADAYNEYAAFMQGLGGIKWTARVGLLAVIAVHIACAAKLTARNTAARPGRYAKHVALRSTPWGRAMLLTGVLVVLFLVFHIGHFTAELWAYQPLVDAEGRRDVYTNFVRSFRDPVLLALYLVAVVAVSLHLSHAVASMFRTLGLAQGRFAEPLRKVGPAVAIITGLGFAVVPLACLLGIITL